MQEVCTQSRSACGGEDIKRTRFGNTQRATHSMQRRRRKIRLIVSSQSNVALCCAVAGARFPDVPGDCMVVSACSDNVVQSLYACKCTVCAKCCTDWSYIV